MAVTVAWCDQSHSLIMVRYGDSWGWTDWLAAEQEIRQMISTVSWTVDVIHDTRDTALPLDTLTTIGRVLGQIGIVQHRNMGIILVVGEEDYLEVLTSILQRIYVRHAQNISRVNDMDTAFAALSKGGTQYATGSLG